MSDGTTVSSPSQPVGSMKVSVTTKLNPILDEAEDAKLVVVDVDKIDVELDVRNGF